MLAALQIARAIREHKGKVTVFVPHYAMSGGTLIALAADEIVMCRHAVLGPIDPQLGQYPGRVALKVVEQKPIAEIDDQTLVIGGRRTQGHRAGQAVCERSPEAAAARASRPKRLAEKLSTGTWTHDYPLFAVDREGTRPAGEHRHAGRRSRAHEALPAADADAERRRRGVSASAAAARDCKTHLSGH